MAKALLFQEKNIETIYKRQNAIDELSQNIELCINLRAVIRNHPVSRVDNENIEKWKKAPLFFDKPYIKYTVYLSNIIMAMLIIQTLFFGLNFEFVSYWFVIQLAVSILFNTRLTKSQTYLDAFIKGFGNYLFPVSLLREVTFNS